MTNKENTDYYKNLCYYYIAQIATVVKPGAKRIAFSIYNNNIELTAFKNMDGSIGIVLLNRTDQNYEYNLCMESELIHDNLDSHAIVCYMIKT